MLYLIDCNIVYLCSHGSPHVALCWLWQCLSVFLWFFLMLHWIDCDIVYLCSNGSSLCCIEFIVTLFFFVLMVRSYFALDWLWYCFSVFLCFYLIIHWIDCGIVYLCSHGSSSCCIGLIVKLFICVLMVFPHVALDWLRYCLPVFTWFFLMLPWIDCDIVFLCIHGSASCCFWFIVTLFIFVLVVLPHVALDLLLHCLSLILWFFLMMYWIDCDIVCLCSHGSSSCCIGLIVALFICVLMVLPHVALDWVWHCLSVFSWFSSCCIVLIVTVFICVLMVLPHVALDWLWHCLSVFQWFFLMLHWIHCYIVFLCSYGSFIFCIGLIVILFLCVLMFLPHNTLNWLWYCLSVFSWFFLMLHWIDCEIVYLCSYGFSSCCIGLIAILSTCVYMVLPHVALDWLWYRFSVYSWFCVMLLLIYCDIVYLCSCGSSSCCIGFMVTLFVFDLMVLPHDVLDWLWYSLSVFSWFFLMLHWIDCCIVYLCSYGSSSCCIG